MNSTSSKRYALLAGSLMTYFLAPAQMPNHSIKTEVIAYPNLQAKKMVLESDLFLKHDNVIRLRDHSGKNISLHSSCYSYDARKLIIDLSELSKGDYVILIYKKNGKIICSTEFSKV
jgi:hypothetical protein